MPAAQQRPRVFSLLCYTTEEGQQDLVGPDATETTSMKQAREAMKADAHRSHAESLERAIALAKPDPATSVALIENAWGAAYHWMSYECIQKYQQHRDKHQGLTAYLVSLGEQRLAQWWRNFEYLRQVFTATGQVRAKFKKHLICLSVFAHEQRPREETSMNTLKKNLEQREKPELIAIITHILRQEPDLAWLLTTPLPTASSRKVSIDPKIYRQQVLAALSASDNQRKRKRLPRLSSTRHNV